MVTFLKKAKSLVPKKTAKFFLHQHLTGYGDGRSRQNIHASSLTKSEGFCPREYALADVTKHKTQDEFLTTSERVTFQIGRDMERNIVLWFAEMGRAVCDWKCVSCGTVHKFTMRPVACKTCGVKVLEPKEVRFVSAVSGASCGIDMNLHLNESKLHAHEIKTMDKEEFKKLEAPLAEHRIRAKLYLKIIAESDDPNAKKIDTDRMTIIYTTKGGYGCADPMVKAMGFSDNFSPFKEYVIPRNDAEIADYDLRAKVVTDFRKGLIQMPHGICSSSMSKRAGACPLRSKCFSGEYPPVHEWKTA